MSKLLYKIVLKGTIVAESGILVGSSGSAYAIGGTDKQVVRNPVTKLPYIPGSSLKGKMRSLFELINGTVENGGPTMNPAHAASQLFGRIKNEQQPSRIIVRDCELSNPDKLKDTELLYTEVKAENSIDRLTAAAMPRFFERVPKGAEFDLEMVINVFDTDTQGDKFLNWACLAMRLVQDDYVGGGGSRGNGQISFKIKTAEKRFDKYYEGDDNAVVDVLETEIPDSLKN